MPGGHAHGESEPDEDDVEPLAIVPYPLPIEAHDPEVGGGSVVRLFFVARDRAEPRDVDLADVVVLETWERVSIGLVRRGVTGEGPDGVRYGESLRRRADVSLDVALAEPLGSRPLVDAWTGEVVRRADACSPAETLAALAGSPGWLPWVVSCSLRRRPAVPGVVVDRRG